MQIRVRAGPTHEHIRNAIILVNATNYGEERLTD